MVIPSKDFNLNEISSRHLPKAGCVHDFADELFQQCHVAAEKENPNNRIAYQITIRNHFDEIIEDLESKDMTYIQSMMFDAIVHMRDREDRILKSLMKSKQGFLTPLTQTLYIPMGDRVKLTCRDVSYAGIRLGLW